MVLENIGSLVLVVGSGVDVVCHSGGSRPPATITWWIDNLRLGQYYSKAGDGCSVKFQTDGFRKLPQ